MLYCKLFPTLQWIIDVMYSQIRIEINKSLENSKSRGGSHLTFVWKGSGWLFPIQGGRK